ncbi:hypothetical protein AYL99_05458 [Fonsecaea erecta]|uniref:Protein kinase domain-containing protein n=1 Tax=Fonsecaea erecta TaxID=1367422 RepID=A0A178ZM38_9EURO|nr:hypothetical protein AYL99_05458 [Fonsecaea erecta]OAP60456.1 hypothetical protein AYL99_05458 [Fonsecaea erecta]
MSTGDDKQLPLDRRSLRFINCGVSGMVYAVDEFSVVKWPGGGENNSRELEIERRIFERLGEHPRIVKVLRVERDMLVLERLQYPLRLQMHELRGSGAKPAVKDILKWSAQAAEGMQYFHSKSVYQVDIGLHNLLLDWDDNVKYCDFAGSSLDGQKALVLGSERTEHPSWSGIPWVQSEIFSLGCMIYEISTTQRVYEGKDELEMQSLYAKGVFPQTEDLLLGPVMRKCWTGGYEDVGLAAAEIRAIQRRTLLGDPNFTLFEVMQHKKAQQSGGGKLSLFSKSSAVGPLLT